MIQGTLLVIPIEESLLYIRPLYLRSQGGRIPELKRVIVAYQNSIVMEPTLEGGARAPVRVRQDRQETAGRRRPRQAARRRAPTAAATPTVNAVARRKRAITIERAHRRAASGRLGDVTARRSEAPRASRSSARQRARVEAVRPSASPRGHSSGCRAVRTHGPGRRVASRRPMGQSRTGLDGHRHRLLPGESGLAEVPVVGRLPVDRLEQRPAPG